MLKLMEEPNKKEAIKRAVIESTSNNPEPISMAERQILMERLRPKRSYNHPVNILKNIFPAIQQEAIQAPIVAL